MSVTLADLDRREQAAGSGFFRRPIPGRLAAYVHSMIGYSENGQRLKASIEMAPLVVPLIISFGDAFEIALGRLPNADETFGTFTSGLYPGFVVINSSGRSQCVQVDFTPLGAYRFFGFPMSEIASRMVPVDDLGDAVFRRLRERLGEMNDWDARLALVETFVAGRLAKGPANSLAMSWTWSTLLANGGDLRIRRIAKHLGWSHRHLAACFRKEIGIEPKAAARMVRFNRAAALAAEPRFDGWAGIAAECGYADQAHLAREFHEFGGRTPSAWCADLP